MIKAGGAEGVFPGIAFKPGKLIGRFAVIDTAWCLGKTPYFVHYSGRIEKGVQVSAVDGNLPVQTGNNCPA